MPGDPLDEATDIGPLIRESDAIHAGSWVQEAVAGGAKLLCGGDRQGSMMQPTLLTHTQSHMKVNCEEVFAPVKTGSRTRPLRKRCGASTILPTVLQAGVFSRDLG
jgi:acyl-CoA reductase-like NAD-dependent aldehyde dehydrogenase